MTLFHLKASQERRKTNLASKGPFTLDDNDITFLSPSVNGIIDDHATHFFFSFLTTKNIEKSASLSSSVKGP